MRKMVGIIARQRHEPQWANRVWILLCKEGCLQIEIGATFVGRGEKLECMCTDEGSSLSQDSLGDRNRRCFI